nr:DnaJ domain-containing protein [Terrihabitans soli]
MKLDSPWFDGIRAAKKPSQAEAKAIPGGCDHPGCAQKGEFKAPKGRDREGQYFNFCVQHVREYNQSYNYFRNMDDDQIQAWQKDSLTGHRPTWTMGVNKQGSARPHSTHPRYANWNFADPYNLFGKEPGRPAEPQKASRTLKKVELNALQELGVEETATAEEIKTRFKTLVKRLHPDANGGDRGTEDKLRAVIQAYNYLKQAGLC